MAYIHIKRPCWKSPLDWLTIQVINLAILLCRIVSAWVSVQTQITLKIVVLSWYTTSWLPATQSLHAYTNVCDILMLKWWVTHGEVHCVMNTCSLVCKPWETWIVLNCKHTPLSLYLKFYTLNVWIKYAIHMERFAELEIHGSSHMKLSQGYFCGALASST